MKLCQFKKKNGQSAIGLVFNDEKSIADIAHIFESEKKTLGSGDLLEYSVPQNLLDLIRDGEKGLSAIKLVQGVVKNSADIAKMPDFISSVDEIQVCAPVSRPPKFFAIAVNRRGVWETATKPDSPHPHYFIKLVSCIIGPYDTIRIPDVGQVGPEIELALVIGKGGFSIPISEALDHVFGYTVHNDVTAHEMRKKTEWIRPRRQDGSEEQLTYAGRYKNYDTFSPMGPWLVTRDEVVNPDNMNIRCWLNSDLVLQGSTSEHIFKTAQLISYLSQAHTLEPGDIISTGTVGPVAPWLMTTIDLGRVGGTVIAEIEGIGRISNPIQFVPGWK